MNINTNYQQYQNTNFKSLKHPVKRFKISTSTGNIRFNEVKFDKFYSNKTLKKIATFFLDNFAHQSAEPNWKYYRKTNPEFIPLAYKWQIENFCQQFINLYQNQDATMLIGKNDKNQIVAGILSAPFNLSPEMQNERMLYVDMLAVDKNYRKNHIATTLIDKVIEKTKQLYDNIFLVSYNESVPFYEKIDFKHLPEKGNKRFIKNLSEYRTDYPEYASFLIKKVN